MLPTVGATAIVALLGCAGGDGPLAGLTPLYDFADHLDEARVVRELLWFDAGDPLTRAQFVEGWGKPEVDPSTGVSFVWAVGVEASVEFVVLRSGPSTLEFRCWPYAFPGGSDQTAQVLVNDDAVASLVLRSARSTYTLKLPDGVLGIGVNRVGFRFAHAESPAEHGQEDSRRLAAAFEYLRIGGQDRAGIPADGEFHPEPGAEGFEVPAGVMVSFTLSVPSQGFLDLELAPAGDGSIPVHGAVTLRRQGMGFETLVALEAPPSRGGRRQIPLEAEAGSIVQIGFAAWGAAEAGGETPRMAVFRPRLYGQQDALEPVPSLLLIVADTLRADHVGVYGSRAATPNLDALASRGAVFANAYSHAPITGPSHSSMFTGLPPSEHGVRDNTQVLDARFDTMAEILADHGSRTTAFVSLGVLQREYGYAQGFGSYHDDFGHGWNKNARELNSEVLRWLEGVRSAPRFLWLHYSDPHEPYAPPELVYPEVGVVFDGVEVAVLSANGRGTVIPMTIPPGVRRLRFEARPPSVGRPLRFSSISLLDERIRLTLRSGWSEHVWRFGPTAHDTALPATIDVLNSTDEERSAELWLACEEQLTLDEIRHRYRQEVEFLDAEIGALMNALEEQGRLDDTLVVFTSDHGEGLGDHNHTGHIHQLYEEAIRVPLILVYPGKIPEGTVVDDRVALVDLLPTVLDLLGVAAEAENRGRSLVPLIDGGSLPSRSVAAATYRPGAYSDKRTLIVGDLKYIRTWGEREVEELYDLATDPDERQNLAWQRPELLAEMRTAHQQYSGDEVETTAAEVELDAQGAARLRALGYLR